MKKKLFIFCILISTCLTGCTLILTKMYGIKDPDYETVASIEEFSNDIFGNKIPFLVLSHAEWKKNNLLSLPDVYVFTFEGSYIPYKDSLRPNCNGPAEIFLSELSNERTYNYGTDYSITNFLGLLDDPGCKDEPHLGNERVDFYVFITFAKFMGKKLCREKTIEWLKALKANTKITYKLVLVNQDLQECWSEEQKKQLESQSGNNH